MIGDRLCLVDLSRCFGDRLLRLGESGGLLKGDRFSFPEGASLGGDFVGFLSFSTSDFRGLFSRSLDLDL